MGRRFGVSADRRPGETGRRIGVSAGRRAGETDRRNGVSAYRRRGNGERPREAERRVSDGERPVETGRRFALRSEIVIVLDSLVLLKSDCCDGGERESWGPHNQTLEADCHFRLEKVG